MRGGPFSVRRPVRLAAVLLYCCSQSALADNATTELRIAVGLLRSQAAELELLHHESRQAGLPERTLRGHAMQLEREVQRAREQLDKAAAPASAAPVRAEAQAAGQQLALLVSRLADTGETDSSFDTAASLREALQRQEAALPH